MKIIENKLIPFIKELPYSKSKLAMVVIIAPLIAVTIYYLLIASSRYESDSRIIIKNSDNAISQLAGLSLPFLGSAGGSEKDMMLLEAYIQSPDMLAQLDKSLGLKKEFSRNRLDFINMLEPWSTKEDFLGLYLKRVYLDYDEKSGILSIGTQGSSPRFAQQLNQAILHQAEKFINDISLGIAHRQLDFASKELQQARKELDRSTSHLLSYQNKNATLDPALSVSEVSGIIAQLKAQLSSQQVQLKTLSAMMQDDAPQILAARETIQSLKRQIRSEESKLTSPKGRALNKKAADYLIKKGMVDFRTDVYKAALTAYQTTRVEAMHKVKNVVVVSEPGLADETAYPKRLLALGGWLFMLSILYFFVRLMLEIVEDHRD